MSEDLGRTGRTWRLILTVFPQLVVAGLPAALIAAFGHRLPERAWVLGWARVGPEWAQLAPSWGRWAGGYLGVLLICALLVLLFRKYWRWAAPQRLVVAASWGLAAVLGTQAALLVGSVLDTAPPVPPTPWWFAAISLLTALPGALLGWLLAGPPPRPAAITEAPPPDLQRRELGRTEVAMYSTTLWSVPQLVSGALLLIAAWLTTYIDDDLLKWAPFAVFGVLVLLHAKARLLIDGSGITLIQPLLGGLRRHVPYEQIRHAEIAEEKRSLAGAVDNPRGWGFLTRSGPALVAQLADGRAFVASPRDPAQAVALINGQLDRLRERAC